MRSETLTGSGLLDELFPDYFKSELMETRAGRGTIFSPTFLSRLLQIGINGNFNIHLATFGCGLSRLLQIGINGNGHINCLLRQKILGFPDYFKSELMETLHCILNTAQYAQLSRLLQIGINGNRGVPIWTGELAQILSRLLQIGINGNPK